MYTCLAKDKSGNLVCNRKFDEEEFNITQDKERCILHCDKDDWHNEKETIIGKREVCDELRYKLFLNKFLNIFKDKNKSLRICGIYFPYNPIINQDALSNVIISEFLEEIFISDCKFYGEQTFLLNQQENFELKNFKIFNIESNFGINFSSCRIKNLNITNSNIKLLSIQFSNFDNLTISGHFSVNDYRKIENINIVASNVKKDCWIYEIDLNCLRLHSVSFLKTTLERLNINKELELDKSKFEERLDFFDVEYLDKLNLEETLLPINSAFLQLTSNKEKKTPIKVLNRETARKIKNSFEQQNNIIEANKYYAIEMQKREDELSKDIKKGKNIFDWLIFKIHGISSNHSQSWITALLCILIVGLISSLYDYSLFTQHNVIIDKIALNMNYKYYIFLLGTFIILSVSFFIAAVLKENIAVYVFIFSSLLAIYLYTTHDIKFVLFTNTVNPFTVMTSSDTLDVIQLLFKIIITFLIYQFIISIRQNTRRK
ncbi:hypothetical protein [Malaciobacter canalis]|uniref:hypothetical protein n=1 Tax=Malaciobacter canalis TaxID=1912871 RepID=UPI00384BF65B